MDTSLPFNNSIWGGSSVVRAQRTCIWCFLPKNSETCPMMPVPKVMGSNPISPYILFLPPQYCPRAEHKLRHFPAFQQFSFRVGSSVVRAQRTYIL